ncbi:hypothetical protein HN51_019206 [Arachis hypogaea]|nr:uncharacterized protein DS421_8g236160 [Arachis hypogaea]
MKKLLAVALLLMVASSSLATMVARKLEAEEMHGNPQEEENEQLSDENDSDHHRIPRKEYGRPGTGQYVVTDDSDHHRIPRRDYGGTHPGQP